MSSYSVSVHQRSSKAPSISSRYSESSDGGSSASGQAASPGVYRNMESTNYQTCVYQSSYGSARPIIVDQDTREYDRSAPSAPYR